MKTSNDWYTIAAWGAGILVLLVLGYFSAKQYSDEPTVFYFGTESSEHDRYYAGKVQGGEVRFGNWCWQAGAKEIEQLLAASSTDVSISGRADSNTCIYNHPATFAHAVSGFGNGIEYVEQAHPYALTITHGAAYGPGIDYCVEAGSLSEAMPLFANELLGVIQAAVSVGKPAPDRGTMRAILDAAASSECVWGGVWVDWDLARQYAATGIPVPPSACEVDPDSPACIAAWLAGGPNYLLLLTEEDNEAEE